MTTLKPKYPCKEDELYAIASIIFENLTADRTRFVAKKAKYTTVYVDGLKTLRTDAMALPDEESRAAVHETVRNLLPALLLPCKDNFNDLKGYIRDGWPGEDPKPRYEAAGLLKYNAIKDDNWEPAVDMNEKMIDFISQFTAELTTGGMPSTFAAKVASDANTFGTKYTLFMTSRETGTARNAKVTANNTLYDAVMDVCEDGVGMIFRTDSAGRKRYTFSVVKDLVSPPGAASLKIMAKYADDNLVMDGEIELKLKGQPALKAKILNGEALFKNVEPGDYDGHAVISGTQAVNFTKKVEVGTNARVEIVVSGKI